MTPGPKKMFNEILDRLYDKYLKEQQAFLKNNSGYGRALTGDTGRDWAPMGVNVRSRALMGVNGRQ